MLYDAHRTLHSYPPRRSSDLRLITHNNHGLPATFEGTQEGLNLYYLQIPRSLLFFLFPSPHKLSQTFTANMNNVSSLLASPISVDVQLPELVSGGKRAGYYITISAVLLTLWLILSRKQTSQLEVPFYKASKKKWLFDAETLIKDSYTKVRLSNLCPQHCICLCCTSFAIKCTRSRPPREYKSWCPHTFLVNSRDCQKISSAQEKL